VETYNIHKGQWGTFEHYFEILLFWTNKKGWTVIVASNVTLLCVKQYINFIRLLILHGETLCINIYFWQNSPTKWDLDSLRYALKHSQFSAQNSIALRNELYQSHEETW